VTNTARVGPRSVEIVGTASPVSNAYGAGGAFVVAFPGTPGPECPGPNYIVQDYAVDWAIVQTQKWNTLYVLSRERTPPAASIEVSSPGRWRGWCGLLTDYRLGLRALLTLGRMLRRLRSLISPAVTKNEKILVFLLGNDA
jgi:hypothetical protein